MEGSVKIETVRVGSIHTNCYIVSEGDSCVVVDPGDEYERIIEALGKRIPSHILITHGHVDHVSAVGKLQEHYPQVKVVVSELDADSALHANVEGRDVPIYQGVSTPPSRIDVLVSDGDTVDCGEGLVFEVIHTPGHTPGCVCYHLADRHVLLSGDTLFAGAVGRTDFKGGSPQAMRESLRRLCVLPPDTKVLPGHSASTTIGDELRQNMLLARAYREVTGN